MKFFPRYQAISSTLPDIFPVWGAIPLLFWDSASKEGTVYCQESASPRDDEI